MIKSLEGQIECIYAIMTQENKFCPLAANRARSGWKIMDKRRHDYISSYFK